MRRKWRTIACLAVIAVCLPCIRLAAARLPLENQALVEKKYAGWSGVLRIWAFEGWTGGETFTGWLNRCASSYEKQHGGVYVEVKHVPPEAIVQMGQTGVQPPDMLLFPPGLLNVHDGLAPLGALPLREGLHGGCAVPVALGGYAWAVNDEAEGTSIPADEAWRKWSAAVFALGEGGASMEEIELTPPGIDLGLPAFAQEEDPMTQFISGTVGRIPVTQRELARLQRLSDQGKGPDWRIETGAAAYTDQLLMMAAVENGGERQALSEAFIAHLLTDECQSLLYKYNAFPVADVPCGYAANSPMAMIDHSLRRDGLITPSAFNKPCQHSLTDNPNARAEP